MDRATQASRENTRRLKIRGCLHAHDLVCIRAAALEARRLGSSGGCAYECLFVEDVNVLRPAAFSFTRDWKLFFAHVTADAVPGGRAVTSRRSHAPVSTPIARMLSDLKIRLLYWGLRSQPRAKRLRERFGDQRMAEVVALPLVA